MWTKNLFLSILCLACATAATAGDYRVGLSKVELTPPFKVLSSIFS